MPTARKRTLHPQAKSQNLALGHLPALARDPETLENNTLMRIARAIEERRGDFDDADIWALGQEALGLLGALIEKRMSR